uniref:Uncharacterized protein n=1 Tax=Anguilla anguilla TaxID=7936 RepID=A0A0E9X1H8_ANGAN
MGTESSPEKKQNKEQAFIFHLFFCLFCFFCFFFCLLFVCPAVQSDHQGSPLRGPLTMAWDTKSLIVFRFLFTGETRSASAVLMRDLVCETLLRNPPAQVAKNSQNTKIKIKKIQRITF